MKLRTLVLLATGVALYKRYAGQRGAEAAEGTQGGRLQGRRAGARPGRSYYASHTPPPQANAAATPRRGGRP